MQTMIHPRHYDAEELRMFKVPLPRRQKTKLRTWMEKTGGIDGEAFGLESESMQIGRLRELLEEEVNRLGWVQSLG